MRYAALLRGLRREGAEWELGESSTPARLVERLLGLGLDRIEDDPVAVGMVLRAPPAWEVPPGVAVSRVSSVDELVDRAAGAAGGVRR